MSFTITVDTGNIEQDILTTIKSYSDKQLAALIDSINFKKEGNNIIGKSIFFRYPDCQLIIDSITDITKVPLETRKIMRNRTKRIDIESLFLGLSDIESVKSDLIKKILELISNKIDVTQKFCNILSNDKYDFNFYNLCFKIISSDEYFNKFLDYNNNINIFGSKYKQEDYVLELSRILGYQEHDIYKENPVYKYPIVSFNMLLRYLKLRKIVNVDIPMLGEEVFNQDGKSSYSKEYQQQIDNDWRVNPDMMSYIMKDMAPEYNLLEQISHIYIKLCQVLRYNLGYHIKSWRTEYNKQRQESISPENNQIICSEFSMILTNIINKLDKSVEARCIVTGKEQHLSVGILIKDKNIRVDLDSTKVIDNFDDLGRIKLGMKLVGVNYLCDRAGEFEKAFNKVYDRICGAQQIKIEDLITAYEILPQKQQINVNFYENMQEFVKQMKEKNVVGSELLSVFKMLNNNGYFGNIRYSIVGQDKKLTFGERELFETAEEVLDGLEENIIINYENEYYLLRLDACELIQMSIEKLNELFEANKMRYFNLKYRIDGVGVKQCKTR